MAHLHFLCNKVMFQNCFIAVVVHVLHRRGLPMDAMGNKLFFRIPHLHFPPVTLNIRSIYSGLIYLFTV